MEPDEVFPELVWKDIFDKVEDDKDKLSFLRAHSAFRKQFEKKHMELGFLFALPALMDYFEKKTPDWSCELNNERKRSFLACRLASRKCSQAVDNWLESHWANGLGIPLILDNEIDPDWTDLSTRQAVEKFMDHFGELQVGRMPILSRSIELAIPTEEDGVPYHLITMQQELEGNERRNEILTAFGEHVRALNVYTNFSNNPGIDNVENLRDRIEAYKSVLEQVPNLESLTTSWEPIISPDWEEEDEVLVFPDLPRLDDLSLTVKENAEEEVGDLAPFEKYFPQLTLLQFLNLDGWKDEYLALGRFPKLRHLEVFNVRAEYCDHRRKLFGMCRNLFAPNLETFSVHICRYSKKEMERKGRRLMKELGGMLNKLFKKENVKWEGNLKEEENKMEFKRI